MQAHAEIAGHAPAPGCGFSPAASPAAVAGLHVLWTAAAAQDWRARRLILRKGVDNLVASWRWSCERRQSMRRRCTRADGGAVAPISVAYSGNVAAVLVSHDGHEVGVDIEVSPTSRIGRYAAICQAFTRRRPDAAMSAFVRAEAWVKATDQSFLRSAGAFLSASADAGLRSDGRIVHDVDLRALLPAGAMPHDHAIAAAICTDARAPACRMHKAREVLADGRLSHGPVWSHQGTCGHG